MANLIERYIHEVVSRLPEKDRADVSMELNANICDMLPDSAGEAEVRSVLNGLGNPSVLAENYRSNPRYLISPSVYDDYVRALKWVLPLVGGICLVVGAIIGAIEALDKNMGELVPLTDIIVNTIVKGLSVGISGAFHTLFWVTIGFVIAERTGAKKAMDGEKWTVDKLPDTIPDDKSKIPLSDSIVELFFIVVFSVIVLLFCFDALPIVFAISSDMFQNGNFFSDSFLAACIPVLIIGSLINIAECIVKIIKRRWTLLVCGTVVVSGIVGIGLMLYLFSRPKIMNPEFLAFAEDQGWEPFDLLLDLGTSSGINPILFIIGAIVIIGTIAECVTAVYRTVKARRSEHAYVAY